VSEGAWHPLRLPWLQAIPRTQWLSVPASRGPKRGSGENLLLVLVLVLLLALLLVLVLALLGIDDAGLVPSRRFAECSPRMQRRPRGPRATSTTLRRVPRGIVVVVGLSLPVQGAAAGREALLRWHRTDSPPLHRG